MSHLEIFRGQIVNSVKFPDRLVYRVISGDFYMYDIPIIDVEDDATLTSGVFSNFNLCLKHNPVSFDNSNPIWAFKERSCYQNTISEMINWCARNNQGVNHIWSFDLEVKSVSTIITTFYFNDEEMALNFKLACL
jgi:hypothetical protein